ncbi:PAS domain-containing protein [Niveispirillum fermenti]|uniref:PAS domain-containing protein n=1 Tax=Niveispirillum fermenti TaxID=1233113 RepID=UPI003A890D38
MRALITLWWQERAAGGGSVVPARAQLDPCAIPRGILPYMFIYERVAGRLRCRLAGTRLRDIFGRDETGCHLDEVIAPQHLAGRTALFDRCLDAGLPLFYRGYLVPAGRHWRAFNRLLLPAAAKAGQPATQVMGLLRVYDPSQARTVATLPADADGLVDFRLLGEDDCRSLLL